MFGFKKNKSPEPDKTEQAGKSGGLFARLKNGLGKTRAQLGSGLSQILGRGGKLDADSLEELEDLLLMSDVGIEASQQLLENLEQSVKNGLEPMQALKSNMVECLRPCEAPLELSSDKKPFVILMVGVNGVGKTTTIGKLAQQFKNQGLEVMLAAGDTFRAAAVEQLQSWGERNEVPVIAQHSGADSAAVIFDALQAAQARGVDVLIADTAGRLHTQSNLMEELKKIKRVLAKLDANAPHETLLVLDAGTGQNALSQATLFHESVELSGLALTKLDGTAKGGIVFALANKLGLPIRYIGVGEGIEDLRPFTAESFVNALVGDEQHTE